MNERSPELIAHMNRLGARIGDYEQNQEVGRMTATFELVAFIAPAAEGKSTIMEAAALTDQDFGYVTGFTTRLPEARDVPGRYRYYNSDEEIAELLADIEAGRVVQYDQHPTTGQLYGSHPSDYAHRFAMLDALYTSLPQIERSGFGRVHKLMIVSRGSEWVNRFMARYPEASPERDKRAREGIDCLEWALEQPVGSLAWIENNDGEVNTAAQEVIAIVKNSQRSRQLQLLAKEMIDEIKKAL